jgi:hypothetical protein
MMHPCFFIMVFREQGTNMAGISGHEKQAWQSLPQQ